MSEAKPPFHLGENSPEEVAYKLMQHIKGHEELPSDKEPGARRKYILDLYDECLTAVRGGRIVSKSN